MRRRTRPPPDPHRPDCMNPGRTSSEVRPGFRLPTAPAAVIAINMPFHGFLSPSTHGLISPPRFQRLHAPAVSRWTAPASSRTGPTLPAPAGGAAPRHERRGPDRPGDRCSRLHLRVCARRTHHRVGAAAHRIRSEPGVPVSPGQEQVDGHHSPRAVGGGNPRGRACLHLPGGLGLRRRVPAGTIPRSRSLGTARARMERRPQARRQAPAPIRTRWGPPSSRETGAWW